MKQVPSGPPKLLLGGFGSGIEGSLASLDVVHYARKQMKVLMNNNCEL
jgi:hypothetical protein